MTCPVSKRPCPDHGFVHGSEAEELRAGIEALLDSPKGGLVELEQGLRTLLADVDARDSLAFCEATRAADIAYEDRDDSSLDDPLEP